MHAKNTMRPIPKHAQDVSGNFRLGGTALSDDNQFVVWGEADDVPGNEDTGGPGDFLPTGPFDMPILIAGEGLAGENDQKGTDVTTFTGDMPILVAGEGFAGDNGQEGTDATFTTFTGNMPILVAGGGRALNVSSTSRAVPGTNDVKTTSSAVGGKYEMREKGT